MFSNSDLQILEISKKARLYMNTINIRNGYLNII